MKYKWGQLISLEYGKPVTDKAKVNGKYPVYGTNGQIGTSDLPSLCNHASFILGRKGAYRGVHYSSIPFSVIDTAFYAENLHPELLNIEWAYYKFLTYDINSMDSGSAIPSTDRYEIYAIEVDLPDYGLQEKVVGLLRSFDDKIKLNNKINDNLEQQARVLLTQWLTENKGAYSFSLLSDVAVINPDTYSPKDVWEYVNYLDTSSITDGIISEIQHIEPKSEKLPSRARRIIAANDIVFSTVRPNQHHFGIIGNPLPNMLASTGFAVIRSVNPSVCNELIYLCITKKEVVERMQQLAEQSTSTFPSIKPSDLGNCNIPCPVSADLAETLKTIFSKIACNQKENTILAELRDTLLPKLMSGEIDVSI